MYIYIYNCQIYYNCAITAALHLPYPLHGRKEVCKPILLRKQLLYSSRVALSIYLRRPRTPVLRWSRSNCWRKLPRTFVLNLNLAFAVPVNRGKSHCFIYPESLTRLLHNVVYYNGCKVHTYRLLFQADRYWIHLYVCVCVCV